MAPRKRSRRASRLIAALTALCIASAPVTPAFAEAEVKRLGGDTRYDTMAMICAEGFEESTYALIATAENFPDALSASALAGQYNAPIILTNSGRMPQQGFEQLLRMGVTKVFIIGGESVIPASIERDLYQARVEFTRIAGANRYETCLEIMRATREAGSTSDTVIIATGEGFADSLSIGPWAYDHKAPIVLAEKGVLNESSLRAIKDDEYVKNILIVGGTSAVSDSIRNLLGDGYKYQRISGPNRYRTSAAIAEWECTQGLNWKSPTIATGEQFPDALAGAALAGSKRSVMLLVSDRSTDTIGCIANHAPSVKTLNILGGPNAVNDRLMGLADWLVNVETK